MNQQPQYTGWNRWLKSAMVERLKQSRKDGTFGTFFADWKWIFGYSRRYRRAVVFYILMGIASSTLSIVSSVAGKYLIDIVLQRNTGRLVFLDRSPDKLTATADRPLSADPEALRRRYEERYDIYCAAADLRVNGDGSPEDTAERIEKEWTI